MRTVFAFLTAIMLSLSLSSSADACETKWVKRWMKYGEAWVHANEKVTVCYPDPICRPRVRRCTPPVRRYRPARRCTPRQRYRPRPPRYRYRIRIRIGC